MIFLAVTMGFIAESLRENIADNKKEKEYINSFVKNVMDDTATMRSAINENEMKIAKLKHLMTFSFKNLSDPLIQKHFFENSNCLGYYSLFKSNDATMLQLTNSGGLRFIKKGHVADSIAKYDNEVKIIYSAETFCATTTYDAIRTAREVFDYSVLHDSSFRKSDSLYIQRNLLITNNPEKIKHLFNMVDLEIGATENYVQNIQRRYPFAVNLIKYLQKRYDLKNV